ncbi:septal ring lytic transglycosylase RlpA family protein [Gluconacetobacter azotocaptans]|uniref:Endolytic peptidoglycan transglycosylase RlpA n=1 Tax=Gluconacetobacter azotocaptans TaxID=142834 RepID=A0A7W4PCY7_9PROT|nr:septal ring lytic transglycosylase RlpA family protein [Gluconacetobacter azotocaptans]
MVSAGTRQKILEFPVPGLLYGFRYCRIGRTGLGNVLEQDRETGRIRSGGRLLATVACLFAFASTACGREATALTENKAPLVAGAAGADTDASPSDAPPPQATTGHPVTAWAASVRAALAKRSHRLVTASRTALSWSEHGVASWYGHLRPVRRTSSGHPFDPHALTAAHPTLPMGTRVLVRSQDTGRSVVVTVNDRGPFLHHRIIDLSPAAAARIGMLDAGTAHVVIEPLTEVAQAEPDDTSEDAIAAAAPGAPRRR